MSDPKDILRQNEFLNLYLAYVEETESPRLFHVWSALSAIAACLGRRVYLPWIGKQLYPNLYVLLVGPPAVKKSTAINLAAGFVRSNTRVRFAPDDTAGQRQGLLSALIMDKDENGEDVLDALVTNDSQSLEAFEMNGSRKGLDSLMVDLRDRHSMYIAADEWTTFIGTKNPDMLTFLIKMFDGTPYQYKLRQSEMVVDDPLFNMIGGTTPTSINECVPAAANGQGFMSRMIMVWADKKHKMIPFPSLRTDLESGIATIFSHIFDTLDGPMELNDAARAEYARLYCAGSPINDPRFVYYCERRSVHLLKLSMVFACARLSKIITIDDITAAHNLLSITERGMPDALGEYGLSPLAHAKQRLMEFIGANEDPVPVNTLWVVMHREMKKADFTACLADLCNAGKIMLVDSSFGPAYVAKRVKRRSADADLLADLAMHSEEGAQDEARGYGE